jgi:glutamate dehydrogenase/leucine dehydrogenase
MVSPKGEEEPMSSAFEAVRGFYEQAAEHLNLELSLREAMATPTREVTIQVRVPMDGGGFRVFKGYRIQYNNARGPYKGGLRFHPNVSLDEIRCFAALMTWKTAMMNIPFGGGKGGVQVEPKLLSEAELERLSRAFMRGIAEVIGPNVDVPAPDVNTNPKIMGWMADEYARRYGPNPAVITGKPISVGGSLGRDSATGRGALICLDHIVRARGLKRGDQTLAIEGYGNAGSWLAILAHELGYRIVALSDSRGAIHHPNGLHPEKVMAHKQETGSVVGYEGAETIDGDAIFGVDCTVFVPAALDESIKEERAGRIKATIILEEANYPVTTEADKILADRGVTVVPDILASGGGVAVSYLEWVQDLQREQWTEERVNGRLNEIMDAATGQVLARAEVEKGTLRDAAYLIGVERVAEAEVARGYR